MTRTGLNLPRRIVHRVAANRIGVAIFAPILHHIDRFVLRLSGHRVILSAWLSGVPVVILTTTGARSGLSRSVPLLCIRDPLNPDRFGLIASNWGRKHHPGWYYNLKANPAAICEFNGRSGHYLAVEAQGAEYQHFMALAIASYAGYRQYRKWVGPRHIPIMVMQPQIEAS
jgi:deazaflavin-dependent oxidoreductase (nitroreductase family)